MSMRISSRRPLRVLALLVGALGVAMCVDGPTGPGGSPGLQRASFNFAPHWQTSAHSALLALADEGLPLDRVRILLIRPVSDTLKDTTITMHQGDPPLTLELDVAAIPNENLGATMQFKSGDVLLFEGTATVTAVPLVTASTTVKPIEITVSYVGPGATATKVVVTPPSGTYPTAAAVQFTATASDDNGTAFPSTPFTWTLDDATLGTISTDGLFTPSGKRGTVAVTAATPNAIKGTATATLTLPPASIIVFSGDNQSAAVTQQVAQPLVVAVLAGDAVGVPGQTVTFAATDGGVVTPLTAVTGANGQAQTTIKIGNRLGAYNFTATVNGFTVGAKATGTLGAAKKMVLFGPAAYAITSGVIPASQSAARIVDDGDNPVPNVSAQVDVTVSGVSTSFAATSDAAGLVQMPASFALSAKSGIYAITVTNAALTGSPISFTATVTAGAPTKLVMVTQPQAIVMNRAVWSPQPSVQLQDVNSNNVAQVGIIVTAAITTGADTLAGNLTATTDATGLATFTGLSIKGSAGGRVVSFGKVGLTATSSNVNVVSGPAAKIVASAGSGQSAAVGTSVPVAPTVQIADVDGNPVQGVAVTFAVGSGGGTVTGATQTTDAAGKAHPTAWTLGTTAGPNTLVASVVTTITGNPVTFTANGLAASATKLTVATPPSPTVNSGAPFAVQPSIQLTDASLNDVTLAGVVVTVAMTSGNGTLNGVLTATTNASGRATFTDLSITGMGGTHTLLFTAPSMMSVTATTNVVAGAPAQLVIVAGNGQTAVAGTAVSIAPRVRVVDGAGNPVSGITIQFALGAGSFAIGGAGPVTDAAGEAALGSWTVGFVAGPNTITATAIDVSDGSHPPLPGVAPNPVTFNATGVAGPASKLAFKVAPPASVQNGAVLSPAPAIQLVDAHGNPVTVAGTQVSISLAGLGGPIQANTDALGVATFNGLSLVGSPGNRSFTFTSTDLTSVTATVFLDRGPPASMIIVGSPQSAPVGQQVASPQGVKVFDAGGNALPNIQVTFAVTPGSGSATGLTPFTDSAGEARVGTWTLGATAGPNTMTASISGSGITPATITATGTAVANNHLQLGSPLLYIRNRQPFTFTVRIIRPDENPVLQSGHVVTIHHSGTGTLISSALTATTDSNGIASFNVVAASTVGGDFEIVAMSPGIDPTDIHTQLQGGFPAKISAFDFPTLPAATVGSALGISPAVLVVDADGVGVRDVSIFFAISGGAGSTTYPGPVQTDDNGIASTTWTLGTFPGLNVMTATAVDTTRGSTGFVGFTGGGGSLNGGSFTGNPVTFNAMAQVGPAAHVVKTNEVLSTVAGSAYAPIVKVTDAFGNLIAGFPVKFSLDSGVTLVAGSIDGDTVFTDETGYASVDWTLSVNEGTNQLTVTAALPGFEGITPAVFHTNGFDGGCTGGCDNKAPVKKSPLIPAPKKPPTVAPLAKPPRE